MKRILVILALFPLFSFSQTEYKIATYKKASDEVYADILQAEYRLKTNGKYWVHTEKIVCLSGIVPKISSHQYTGMQYKPSVEEIKKWKSWFNKNKAYVKYISDAASGEKYIVYHNPKEPIKLSDCFTKKSHSH